MEIKLKLQIELAELELAIFKADKVYFNNHLWLHDAYARTLLGEQIELMIKYASVLVKRIDLL